MDTNKQYHTSGVTNSGLTKQVDLAEFGYSEVKSINASYPAAASGDIFIVCGKFGSSERRIVFVPLISIEVDAVDAVLQKAHALRNEIGSDARLSVFIVPKHGLKEAPHEPGTFFNISVAPDYRLLFSRKGQSQQDHGALRDSATTKLIEALQSLSGRRTLPAALAEAPPTSGRLVTNDM
jgi:hypothetical protein